MKDHVTAVFAPDGKFTRYSEGAFLRLKDGGILFVCSRFSGGYRDDSASDLASFTSSDEGETWSDGAVALPASAFGAKNVMSVSLMRMLNGDVGMFFIVKQSPGINRIMLARSRDEGASWYGFTECTPTDRRGYYVLNNDRAERLKSGRILLPLAFHRADCSPDGSGFIDGRGAACFEYSDDDGATWHEAPDAVYPPFTGSSSGLQETGVAEKTDGTLWAYNRTDKMYQYEYFSFDGGLNWTEPQPSRFTSPCSPMKIKRHPSAGDLYAVWNPVPEYNGRYVSRAGRGRTPLVWAVSRDDGGTWSECRVIEDGPENGYCYPAVFFTDDGAMLTAYCSGGPEDGICLAKLTIKKIGI